MVEKRLDVKWYGFQMPFEYRTAQPFEYVPRFGIQMFPVFRLVGIHIPTVFNLFCPPVQIILVLELPNKRYLKFHMGIR